MAQLAALALPWAKELHPAKYAETVGMVDNEAAFMARCLRLIELHAATDPAWRNTVPLSVLEQTAVVVQMRHRPTGTVLEVKGRRAPKPRQWSFTQLALDPVDFTALLVAVDAFDLEHDDA